MGRWRLLELDSEWVERSIRAIANPRKTRRKTLSRSQKRFLSIHCTKLKMNFHQFVQNQFLSINCMQFSLRLLPHRYAHPSNNVRGNAAHSFFNCKIYTRHMVFHISINIDLILFILLPMDTCFMLK